MSYQSIGNKKSILKSDECLKKEQSIKTPLTSRIF